MKKLCTLAAIAALTLGGFTTSATAGGDQSGRTIAELVALSGGEFDDHPFDYDLLLTALDAAGLVDALDNPDDDLTVFAPNDRAFIKTAQDLGFKGDDEEGAWLYLVDVLTVLGEGDPIPVLTAILTYHVAPEGISAIEFIIRSIFRQPIPTLQGGTIKPMFFRVGDNEPDLQDPYLFWPINIKASNGYVHTINRVLIPVDLP